MNELDSARPARPIPKPIGRAIAHVGLALTVAFAGLALGAGYWQVIRSPDLSDAPDNPAVIAAARNVVRGQIMDRDGKVLATNRRDPATGEPYRVYTDRAFSTVIGYATPTFGTRRPRAVMERPADGDLGRQSDRRCPPQVPGRSVRPAGR